MFPLQKTWIASGASVRDDSEAGGVARVIFQAVGFFRVESCPTQAVLALVGLAAEKVIRDRYILSKRSSWTVWLRLVGIATRKMLNGLIGGIGDSDTEHLTPDLCPPTPDSYAG